ncbi:MAG: adenosylmethionine--8-amino-7-oxononanoate transaminase [Planctomycetes bacterium]|nr:adenosylmethionine--8-amino-7-oxononanoate transaminase [Planctomycetota bacterium]
MESIDSWIDRDLKHLWHPYTQMKDCETLPPIKIDRAQGLQLYADDGKAYYDTVSSWWCNIHGHNHPRIRAAIHRQLQQLDHCLFAGFTHGPAIELAERLVDITPENLDRVFYSDNGSTAVEVALKMSLQYWGNIGRPEKSRFVGLDMGYHGDTVGAMSVAGESPFSRPFKAMLFDTFKVPTPYCYRCPLGKSPETCHIECVDPLERLLADHHQEIAAIILEPMLLAAAGMIAYPADYLRKVAELAQRYDCHLILDEVAVGFGRTGRMFACEHAEVKPDFLCLSKGLTSGTLPFAATLTTDTVYQAFYDDYSTNKTLYHGHTYAANPIGCAAALATLDLFEEEDTLARARPVMARLQAGLAEFRDLNHVGDVRGIGMVGALELVRDRASKERFDPAQRVGMQVFRRGLAEGLILRPLADVVYLFLPLCTTLEELDLILAKLHGIVRDLSRDLTVCETGAHP